MTILVVGDANADLTALISHFPAEGDDSLVRSLTWGGGGSATNTAVALARLGTPTRLMSRVGVDPIAQIALRAAHDSGVDMREIQTDRQLATGLCYAVISPSGERSFFSFRGANAALSLTDPATTLHDIAWLHVGGHALMEHPQRDTALTLIAKASDMGIPVSLDLCLPLIRAWREHLLGLLPKLALLFANETELCLLATGEVSELANTRPLAWYTARVRAQAAGMAGVIVGKCGAAGCIVDHGSQREVAGFRVDVADTNGCGDAFVAGFLAARLVGTSFAACGLIGNACGALAASHPGAAESLPNLLALREFVRAIPDVAVVIERLGSGRAD